MKKKVLILLIFFSKACYAQYYPMLGKHGNEWLVKVSGLVNSQTNQVINCNLSMYTYGDSIIGNQTYKKIFAKDDCGTLSFSPLGFVGLLSEDTANRKIYYLAKGSQKATVVYDFNLINGDSIYLNFAPFAGTYIPDHSVNYLPVMSDYYKAQTGSQSMPYGLAKKITISNNKYFWQGMDWVEGLGSIRSPLYFLNPLQTLGGCCYRYLVSLTCAYKDGVQIYGNNNCKSGIEYENNPKSSHILAYLSNNVIKLSTRDILPGTFDVMLFDINGRKLFSRSIYQDYNDSFHSLELGVLPAKGIYLLVCSSPKFNYTIKIINF